MPFCHCCACECQEKHPHLFLLPNVLGTSRGIFLEQSKNVFLRDSGPSLQQHSSMVIQKAEAGGLQIRGQPRLHETLSQNTRMCIFCSHADFCKENVFLNVSSCRTKIVCKQLYMCFFSNQTYSIETLESVTICTFYENASSL